MPRTRYNIFVGAETGVLKGVQVSEHGVQTANFHNLNSLNRQHEVSSLAWADAEQTQLLLGLRSQEVKVYDTRQGVFTQCRRLSSGSGPVIGLGKYDGAVLTAVESGAVTLWRFEESQRVTIDALQTGEALCRMRQSTASPGVIATGGRENDLQLWNLDRPEQPTFRAKNVRHDMLDMRVPVWVTDIAFMEDPRRVATCHRHSAVRLYDTTSGRRRPVLSLSVTDDEPLTAMALSHREYQVLVGSGRGRLEMCDLRMGRSVGALKGLAGGVRAICCHPEQPFSGTVSLDRFLSVHNLETRKLVHKVYLKSRLNCVLMRRDFSLEPCEEEEPEAAADVIVQDDVEPLVEGDDDDLEIVEEFLDQGDRPESSEAEDTPKKKHKDKRKLPKLKRTDEDVAGKTPKKQKLPKLVDMSSKKKKKRSRAKDV